MNFFKNKPSLHLFAVFIVAYCIIALQLFFLEKETPYADNITYMAVAAPLYETGVYRDGNFENSFMAPGPNGEGMFLAPLYPGFLSVIMWIDSGFYETALCTIENIRPDDIDRNCDLNFMTLWAAQILLAALSCLILWQTAFLLFQKRSHAWITVGLMLSLGNFAYYASIVMAEALLQPLFYLTLYLLMLSWHKKRLIFAILMGIAAGLLILTKPSFIYMAYVFIAFFLAVGLVLYVRKKELFIPKAVLLAIVGISIVCAPWIVRNAIILDKPSITFGYGAFTLAQRVAYNDMRLDEWLVSWVYGIPGEGDNIAKMLFPKESYERWGWADDGTFYGYGNRVLRAQTLEEAGSHEAHQSYLIKNYILADLPKHVAVTFPLVYRGMWVFELWLFLPYLAFLFLAWQHMRQGRYDYIIYAAAAWFMLGLHGFASVNIPRYNIIMQGSLAMALSWAFLCLYARYQNRQSKKSAS